MHQITQQQSLLAQTTGGARRHRKSTLVIRYFNVPLSIEGWIKKGRKISKGIEDLTNLLGEVENLKLFVKLCTLIIFVTFHCL